MREYLSDVIEERECIRVEDKINLIVAPCGCGKTHYIVNHVLTEERFNDKTVLYVVDTSMLKDAMANDGFIELVNENQLNTPGDYVCTYQRLGNILAKEEVYNKETSILSKIDLLICDEAHNLVKYAMIAKGVVDSNTSKNHDKVLKQKAQGYMCGCSYLLSNLTDLKEKYKNMHVIMLTATPDRISKHPNFKGHVYDVLQGYEPKGYESDKIEKYSNYKNITKIEGKAFVYVSQIRIAKEMQKHFEELGYRAECLWSTSNKEHKLSEEQEYLRRYLIVTEKYPPYLDILIVTEAYETGWNLSDEDVQTVIVHTTMDDSVTQARGRVRHDIKLLYTKDNTRTASISLIRLQDKFLNKWLTKEDLEELVQDVKILDSNNRLVKWTRLKAMLEDERYYTVEQARKKLNGAKNALRVTYISVTEQ